MRSPATPCKGIAPDRIIPVPPLEKDMKTMTLTLAILVVLALCTLASAQNAANPSPAPKAPATAPAAAPSVVETPEGCTIEKLDVPSPSMKRQIRAVVVLPPGYKQDAEKRYPIVYALHGKGAPYATYSEMLPLRRALKDRPMIVASFDCDDAGWYIDSARKPGNLFETFFFAEFLPYVDGHYRTSGQRAVTGFSMGGFGAFHYMLAKPEMFTSVSAHSAAFFRFRDANDRNGPDFLKELLGEPSRNREAYAKLDVGATIAENVQKGVRMPPMLFHCGTEDGLLNYSQEMARLLARQNKLITVDATKDPSVAGEADNAKKAKAAADLAAARRISFWYIESPGGHNWVFWRDSIEIALDFHWRHFRDAKRAATR